MRKFSAIALVMVLLVAMSAGSFARVLVKDKSVVKIGENINMGSDLAFKDLVTIKGDINVKGNVSNDIVAVLGNIHIYPTANIGGDIVVVGGTIIRDAGSIVNGEIVEIGMGKEAVKMAENISPMTYMVAASGFALFKLMMVLGFIGLATIVVSFLTPQIGKISSVIERDWLKNLMWGMLGMLLILPVAFLLAVTIVGIPLIAVEILIISLAMLFGYLSVAQLIGKKFLKAIKKPDQPMLIEVIAGLLLFFFIEFVPVLGPIVKLMAVTIGFGSALQTKLGF